jgi:CheY-like chemotaxis protein
MLRRMIGEDVQMETRLASDLGWAKADASQIEQVLMNLAVNARDAMPTGGRLTLETANMELDEAYSAVRGTSMPQGRYVMLAVSDTGTGMDEELQRHVFEPFFTTKEKGRGTGLDLSTVYGIVQQSGGYIVVYSEPDKGTSFKIYLPRIDERPERTQPSERSVAAGGKERVLLVEDDALVRKASQRILRGAGYEVLEAAHGGEALAIAQGQGAPIDLLLTDIVMPGQSGKEIVQRLVSSHPAVRVIYMSGYTDGAIVHHGVLKEGADFVQKPFSPDTLLRKVREVLDR